VRLGTFVRVFSDSPFRTRTGGKSTIAKGGAVQARCSDRKFYSILAIGGGENAILSVEYSIQRCCAICYCARQSLYDRILPVQDRASCLPESSRRALVADAREIRQYQMHPPSPLRSVTDTQSVALLSSSPGATLAAVLRMQPREVLPPQFSASRSFTSRTSRSAPGRHSASRESSLRISPSTFNCRPSVGGRPPSKLPEHTEGTCKPSFSRTCYLGPFAEASRARCLADAILEEHGL
jgi:hypothetical protein